MGYCGAGAFVECVNGDLFSLCMCGGWGTNPKGGLLALWLVLFFVTKAHIDLEQVARDSLTMIQWVNEVMINALALEIWLA